MRFNILIFRGSLYVSGQKNIKRILIYDSGPVVTIFNNFTRSKTITGGVTKCERNRERERE